MVAGPDCLRQPVLLERYVSEWRPATVPEYANNLCERKKEEKADVAVRVRQEQSIGPTPLANRQ